jgi:FtsH-binding integral membrane protein
MVNYSLIVGGILCVLGIFMRVGWLDIIISRYESFQKTIRKKNLRVDREGLAKFYSNTYFVLGVILLIAAVIQSIMPEFSEIITLWIFIAVAGIGIVGILYSNLSNRYLKYD